MRRLVAWLGAQLEAEAEAEERRAAYLAANEEIRAAWLDGYEQGLRAARMVRL